jgi:uncharacterized integral membrane protein
LAEFYSVNNRPPESPQNPNDNSPLSGKNAQRFWIILGVVILLLFLVIIVNPTNLAQGPRVTLDQLAQQIEEGRVTSIIVVSLPNSLKRLSFRNNRVITARLFCFS